MRRYVPLLIAGCALIAAACRDVAAPPKASPTEMFRRLGGGPNSFSKLVDGTEDDSAEVITFELLPEGGFATIGDFRLDYDSNAVCDPTTSEYGPLYWQASCTTLTQPITITARFWTENGEKLAEFLPDIRFSPEKNVILSAANPALIGTSLSGNMLWAGNIWYVKQIGNLRLYLDESFYDSSLATQIDPETGTMSRKVRHFTTYSVRIGPCGGEGEDPCPEEDPEQP